MMMIDDGSDDFNKKKKKIECFSDFLKISIIMIMSMENFWTLYDENS